MREPAAFGRLCVETGESSPYTDSWYQPPSGGCVLKHGGESLQGAIALPAAFGRLCVETIRLRRGLGNISASRLRAAVC